MAGFRGYVVIDLLRGLGAFCSRDARVSATIAPTSEYLYLRGLLEGAGCAVDVMCVVMLASQSWLLSSIIK